MQEKKNMPESLICGKSFPALAVIFKHFNLRDPQFAMHSRLQGPPCDVISTSEPAPHSQCLSNKPDAILTYMLPADSATAAHVRVRACTWPW